MTDYEDIFDEKNQGKRIEIVLTDTYGEYEAQVAFDVYVEEHISFPFQARLRETEKSAVFTVKKFTSLETPLVVCEVDINGVKSRTPLGEIEPVDKKSRNCIVIDDYLKFISTY